MHQLEEENNSKMQPLNATFCSVRALYDRELINERTTVHGINLDHSIYQNSTQNLNRKNLALVCPSPAHYSMLMNI